MKPKPGKTSVVALTVIVTLAGVLPLSFVTPAGAATSAVTPTGSISVDPGPTPTGPASAPSPSTSPSTPSPNPSPEPTTDPPATTTPTPEAVPESPDAAPEQVQPLAIAAPVPVPGTARLSTGSDTYAAAVLASSTLFPNGSPTVVMTPVSSPGFSAAAAQLAAEHGAAVLPVPATSLPSSISAELRRLAPTRVIIFGGWPYLSTPVINAIRAVMPFAEHIGGESLQETSRQAFARSTATADTTYMTAVSTIEDVSLGATLAAAADRRFLVVNSATAPLDQLTIDTLRAAGTRSIVFVHSTSSVADTYLAALRAAGFAVEFRSNRDPYAMAAQIAGTVGARPTTAILVNPARAADLGLAAAVAGVTRQPIYFAWWECVPDVPSAALRAAGFRILAVGEPALLSAPAAANSACSVERPARIARLDSLIRSTMSAYAGTYTVTVRQLGGLSEVVSIGSGVRREPASMMKIFAAWAALKIVEQGRASMSTMLPSGVSLGTCLQVMIHASDNFCHSDIVHWITIPEINRMISSAGFVNTFYGTVPRGTSVLYAGNRSTSNDLAWMMERLDNATILSRPLADHLINLMGSQIFRTRIASGLPPGIRQASKPGALWIASGLMQGDTALVWGGRYKYVISIIGDDGPPQAALRAISRVVYEHLNGSFGSTAVYPTQQMVTVRATALRTSAAGPLTVAIPAGTPLEVIDANRIWYQVQYGSRKLWTIYSDLRNR